MRNSNDIFEGFVSEEELTNLADMNQEGGWEIVASITAIVGITFVTCPTAPCTNTGYCK